jgi:hypothetical protein
VDALESGEVGGGEAGGDEGDEGGEAGAEGDAGVVVAGETRAPSDIAVRKRMRLMRTVTAGRKRSASCS